MVLGSSFWLNPEVRLVMRYAFGRIILLLDSLAFALVL